MISLQHADKNNADGNNHFAATQHTLCTYVLLVHQTILITSISVSNNNKLRREGDMTKNKTGTNIRTFKSGPLYMYV